MNAEQIENQEIWKQVKGAEKLFQIYGYFPTLHDAVIENINIILENKEFYLMVRYSDLTEENDKSARTRFTICWRNVQKADFNWYGEDLYEMMFSSDGSFIKTTFKDYPPGFEGTLISGEIEITNIEIEPEKDENNRGIIKFSIN
jgi:hypothetical protein